MVRVSMVISGVVQGVYYRASTVDAARELGLKGKVWNNLNGTVEVIAEGNEADLKRLISWCYEGPPSAVVNNIDIVWGEYTGEFPTFTY